MRDHQKLSANWYRFFSNSGFPGFHRQAQPFSFVTLGDRTLDTPCLRVHLTRCLRVLRDAYFVTRRLRSRGSRVYSGRTQCERALVRAKKLLETCFSQFHSNYLQTWSIAYNDTYEIAYSLDLFWYWILIVILGNKWSHCCNQSPIAQRRPQSGWCRSDWALVKANEVISVNLNVSCLLPIVQCWGSDPSRTLSQ